MKSKLFLLKIFLSLFSLSCVNLTCSAKNIPIPQAIKWNVAINKAGETAEFAGIKFYKNVLVENFNPDKDMSVCGGVLDGEKLEIITAAHCLKGEREFTVTLGEVTVKDFYGNIVPVGFFEARFRNSKKTTLIFEKYPAMAETLLFIEYLENNFRGDEIIKDIISTVERNLNTKILDFTKIRNSETTVK